MRLFVLSCALALVLGAAGCASQPEKKVDLDAAVVAARAAVDQFPIVMDTEDMDLASRLIAHDADIVGFGTDATERWVGWDSIKTAMQKQFDSFSDSHITVHDQVVKVAPSGDVAWFSELMDWNMKADDQTVSLQGVRLTGVLEKRPEGWVIVQFHTSMPVQGQAAQY
jgi:ketosteroid isomerase-like protein